MICLTYGSHNLSLNSTAIKVFVKTRGKPARHRVTVASLMTLIAVAMVIKNTKNHVIDANKQCLINDTFNCKKYE